MSQQPLIRVNAPRAYRTIQDRTAESVAAWSAGQIDAEIASLAALAHDVEAMQARAVERARALGLSWAQIAALLGVTKQAAHKRFGVNRG